MEPQQPAPQPMMTPPQVPPVTNSPSSALSITALVLSIVGFLLIALFGIGIIIAIVAIIVAAVALAKHSGGKIMAIIALVVSGLTVVFGGLLLLISLVAFNGIQDRAATQANLSSALTLIKYAEAYNAEKGVYPTLDQLESGEVENIKLDSTITSKVHSGESSSVTEEAPLAYDGCSAGVNVYYWDGAAQSAKTLDAGDPSSC